MNPSLVNVVARSRGGRPATRDDDLFTAVAGDDLSTAVASDDLSTAVASGCGNGETVPADGPRTT
jgi:hypothetical protein